MTRSLQAREISHQTSESEVAPWIGARGERRIGHGHGRSGVDEKVNVAHDERRPSSDQLVLSNLGVLRRR